jgi:hypothetical protein
MKQVAEIPDNTPLTDIDDKVCEAACKALDILDCSLPLILCRPWMILDGKRFLGPQSIRDLVREESVPPQIERLLFSLAMFHGKGKLGAAAGSEQDMRDLPVQLHELFNFFKSLPFMLYTKHLPAIAALVQLLKDDFKQQFNLAYLFLRAIPTCGDIVIERENLTNFFGPDKFAPSGLDRSDDFKEAMRVIDSVCPKGLSAYHRLVEFSRRAVEVHNCGILGKTKNLTIGSIAPKDVLPYMSIANTFLPALVEVFSSEILGDAQSPWAIITQTVKYMLSGDRADRLPICFPQLNEPIFSRIVMDLKYDVFGFDENLFLESLRTAEPPQEMVRLRKALLAIPDNGFEPECSFNPPAPGVCILLILFDCPPLGAHVPRLFPLEGGQGVQWAGKDRDSARILHKFLRDYLGKEGDASERLEGLGQAIGTVVHPVLRAIPV